MNTTEKWRTAPALPDYEVSSFGRVRRKEYTSLMPRGGVRVYGGKPHFGFDGGEGRLTFTYKGKTYKVHQLVCSAFNGPRKEGQVCMHLDEDYQNNTPDNLRWGTQKENLNAVGFIEYCRGRVGENSPTAKSKNNG